MSRPSRGAGQELGGERFHLAIPAEHDGGGQREGARARLGAVLRCPRGLLCAEGGAGCATLWPERLGNVRVPALGG